jgi:hypothetical protein
MALMAGERGAVVCLGMVCIMLVMTAGCGAITSRWAQEDLTEKDCLEKSGIDRDHCYKNLAVTSNNSTLCEKIEDPGPNSKCYLELGLCNKLFSQATGDGAYTKYDCYQYKAISKESITLCEDLLKGYESQSTNDLNPNGISKEICIKKITKNCGHLGQNACHDKYYQKDYCVEGVVETFKCVQGS